MAKSYREDEEDRLVRKKMLVYCVLAASIVVLIFLYMLYKNNEERHKRLAEQAKEQQRELEELKASQEELKELGVGENNLRSEDLDFWDMYQSDRKSREDKEEKEKEKEEFIPEKPPVTPLPKKTEDGETASGEVNIIDRAEDDANISEEESDGTHIGVTDANGKTIYYEIMDEVARNEYTFASSLDMKKGRISYNDGDIRSLNGVTVSKTQGNIDWGKVKADGYDFAMVKVAFRGYDSGIISLDEKFVENSRGASQNGLAVGAYFSTQAISELEAVEEANFTVGAIAQYGITYPVAIYIENIKNDTARTDKLSMEDRTSFVKAWLDTVKSYGFTPAVYADRNTLIRDVDLSKLTGYSILLIDPVDYKMAKEEGFDTEQSTGLLPAQTTSSSTQGFGTNPAVTPVPSQTASSSSGSLVSSGSSRIGGMPSSRDGVYSVYSDITALSQRSSDTERDRNGSSDKKSVSNKDGSSTDKNMGFDSLDIEEGRQGEKKDVSVAKKKWYTDFPYRFSIWQYNQTGTVDGINGSVPISIGFIDYSQR